MVDYQKCNLINTDIQYIYNHELLNFKYHYQANTETGAIEKYISFYRGLTFTIYEPTEKTNYKRLVIEGSLHKYWNNGAHNFNDFGINELIYVLEDLRTTFKIHAENMIFRCLEIGINLIPPHSTKSILNQCIMHKKKPFKNTFVRDEGNYIQVENQQYYVKIYDKKTHYQNKGFKIKEDNIIRIEKKWRRLHELKQLNIYSMKDLLDYGLSNFKKPLINMWDNILFCDKNLLKRNKYEFKYNNSIWWQGLTTDSFKYHRKNLNKILLKNPNNTKEVIRDLILKKIDLLNVKKPQINSLYIGVKESEEPTETNRRFCTVTGLNISMQKENSFLLSHTGIKYYFKTDKTIYREVKSKYLSNKWNDSDYKIIIKELAHSIRNKYNNYKIKKAKENPLQLEMF